MVDVIQFGEIQSVGICKVHRQRQWSCTCEWYPSASHATRTCLAYNSCGTDDNASSDSLYECLCRSRLAFFTAQCTDHRLHMLLKFVTFLCACKDRIVFSYNSIKNLLLKSFLAILICYKTIEIRAILHGNIWPSYHCICAETANLGLPVSVA